MLDKRVLYKASLLIQCPMNGASMNFEPTHLCDGVRYGSKRNKSIPWILPLFLFQFCCIIIRFTMHSECPITAYQTTFSPRQFMLEKKVTNSRKNCITTLFYRDQIILTVYVYIPSHVTDAVIQCVCKHWQL
jgi:hypothetical protein